MTEKDDVKLLTIFGSLLNVWLNPTLLPLNEQLKMKI